MELEVEKTSLECAIVKKQLDLNYLKGEWHVGVPNGESLTVDGANGDPKAIGAVFGQLGYVGGDLKGL